MLSERYIYDRVYLLGVDGAGRFFTETDTPNLDRIFADGAYNHNVLTSIPTISAQCWGSMLHGVSPAAHRLTNSIADEFPLPDDFPYPSIFKITRAAYPEAKLSAISNWSPINRGIIERGLCIRMGTGEDAKVCEQVIDTIVNDDPKLLFVQFDSVDGAGHHYGYGTDGHLAQIRYIDEIIGKIYDAAENAGRLENTLFLVTADHGGTPDGHHGGNTDAEKIVSFYAKGASVIKGEFGEMEIRDTASIVAHALGLIQPENWSSRVPDNLFKDCIPIERPAENGSDGKKRYSDRPNKPTPTDEDKTLGHFINTKTLLCHFPLDGSLLDIAGGRQAEFDGKLYYTEGFYGQGVTLDDCVVRFPSVDFGKDSFSVCVWIKKPEAADNEKWCVFSTKDDENGNDIGIGLLTHQMEMEARIGVGSGTIGFWRPLPANYQNNWFHFIVTMDRPNKELKFYYDFACDSEMDLDDLLPDDVELNGKLPHFGNHTPLTLDDILVFDHRLSDSEIHRLQLYYEQ